MGATVYRSAYVAPDLKVCPSCKGIFQLCEFAKDSNRRDGLKIYCRGCEIERMKRYRNSEAGKATTERRRLSDEAAARRRELNKKRREDGRWNKERDKRHAARRAREHPEKALATKLVNQAIQRGELKRPTECSECGAAPVGSDGRSLIHGHHDDYSKPLEVRWLCHACHNAIHNPRISGD